MYTTINKLLQDAETTNNKIDKYFDAINYLLSLLEQVKNKVNDFDYDLMLRFSSEIIRDSKILKRRINLLLKKIDKQNLDNNNEELNDEFLSILNLTKEYNNKWSKFYIDIYELLEKVVI